MNYLAHLFLSGDSDDLLVGNLIGDFVKGRINGQFPGGIGDGIILHRQIDSYSNNHPRSLTARNRFSGKWRRFAGIILDICFDHFLIRHWEEYSRIGFYEFTDDVYHRLQPYGEFIGSWLPFLISRESLGYLLEANEDLEGVMFTLSRISSRMKNGRELVNAVEEIEETYEALDRDFSVFFPDLVAYVSSLHPDLSLSDDSGLNRSSK